MLQNINDINIHFIQSIVALIAGMLWSFVYCYFSTQMTIHTDQIRQMTYHAQWFNYPLRSQKKIILVLMRTQKSVKFTGCQLITATLETFLKVRRHLLELQFNAMIYILSISKMSYHFIWYSATCRKCNFEKKKLTNQHIKTKKWMIFSHNFFFFLLRFSLGLNFI